MIAKPLDSDISYLEAMMLVRLGQWIRTIVVSTCFILLLWNLVPDSQPRHDTGSHQCGVISKYISFSPWCRNSNVSGEFHIQFLNLSICRAEVFAVLIQCRVEGFSEFGSAMVFISPNWDPCFGRVPFTSPMALLSLQKPDYPHYRRHRYKSYLSLQMLHCCQLN